MKVYLEYWHWKVKTLIQDFRPTLRSHTHWLVAHSRTQTKTSQRVCLPTADKKEMYKKHERTTKAKNHSHPTGWQRFLARPLCAN
jgi:hypothetical protein